jgi:hypothetical protein
MKSRTVVAVAILAVAIVIGLELLGSRPEPRAPNPLIQARLARIGQLEARIAAGERVADSLRRRADTLGERTPANPAGAFTLTPLPAGELPAVALTPNAGDTTAFMLVHRIQPAGAWPVPRFFVDAYLAERDLRLWHERYTIPYKDSLNRQVRELANDWRLESDKWYAKAHPRCGTKCKLALGAGLGLAARRFTEELLK